MSSVQPPAIRFSGYRLVKHGQNGKAELYLPGYQNADVQAEAIFPYKSGPEPVTMKKQGDYWVSERPVPLGTAYRFKVNGDRDRIPAQAARAGETNFTDVAFKKNGNIWELEQAPLGRVAMTYRIPISDDMPRLRVEKCMPGQPPEPVRLVKDGNHLTFTIEAADSKKAPPGTTYRLAHGLDCMEVVQDAKYGTFNRVDTQGWSGPQKSAVIADIFQDSIVPSSRLQELERQTRKQQKFPEIDLNQPHVPVLPMANHFTQWAASADGTHEAGLIELMPHLQHAGFTGVLFKPFIGGDTISSHGYWTVDPYVLNGSFRDKAGFRAFLADSMKRGMKVFADGAFVNQGLNGVQMMSNLAHGFSSPYWRWMKYGDESQPGGPSSTYPSLAHGKAVFGLLPTAHNPKSGQRAVDYTRFAFRVLNDPSASRDEYQPKAPTFVELYDPRLERPDGSRIEHPSVVPLGNQDSIQKLKFPVSTDELKSKRADLQKAGQSMDSAAGKKLFSQWSNFRLDVPSADDSGVKWDGQVAVALMNTKNPEVMNYLEGAVGYWSRMVMNSQIGTVTRALSQAAKRLKTNDPQALLQALTRADEKDKASEKVLPPLVNPEVEAVTADEANAILAGVQPDCEAEEAGHAFSNRLITEIPMSVLPLPVLFKATLSLPGLQAALQNKHRSWLANFIDANLLQPLSRVPLIGPYIQHFRNSFLPSSFQEQLGEKMKQIFEQLKPETQTKLRYASMQSQLADRLGERIYLALLTEKTLEEVRELENKPKALEKAFYEGMPASILKADPYTGAKLLPRLLKQRLDNLKPVHVAAQVEAIMKDLDPRMAALAQEVIQRRELGLNWRIDAAKDVADMDRVYNAEPSARPKLFQEEVQFMKHFWDQLNTGMRQPRTSIIAELTDFDKLSDNQKPVAEAALKQLLGENTFNGTPNMSYLYSALLQLVNYAQRPDEYGNTQMSPGDFMGQIRSMSEAVPVSALHQYQNLTSSHDYPTTSHAMLINPALFTMDLQKWWGLKGDFMVALDELSTKPCFEEARQRLSKEAGVPNLTQVLGILGNIANNPEIKNQLSSRHLRDFFDEASKVGGDPDAPNPVTHRPTPHELKPQFVEELFRLIKPQDLGLTAEQLNTIRDALKVRISEPSEAKAMRGVIMNAQLQLEGGEPATPKEQALWRALDAAVERWGRHFGYQPLDIAINHVFEKLDPNQLPEEFQDPKALEQWKAELYNQATQPVMDNLKKVFAVQNALPGNPSVYLPDLFAQGGSEWTKNIFCQNRNLIRMDKLQDKQFQTFFEDVGHIFKTRSNPQLQALNNGIVLPVTPDDTNGVLPIVRDNGQQQVITLVNTGLPKALDWQHKAGVGSQYETVARDIQAELKNYQPDLSELHLPQGTRYRDVMTNEAFVLNADGKLVSAANPQDGLTLRDWRMLVRENPQPTHE